MKEKNARTAGRIRFLRMAFSSLLSSRKKYPAMKVNGNIINGWKKASVASSANPISECHHLMLCQLPTLMRQAQKTMFKEVACIISFCTQ
ncbi:MAG: hypothetical protein R2830_18575 [Saprospiraceae bacterium]